MFLAWSQRSNRGIVENSFRHDQRTSLTEFLIRDLEQRNYVVLRFGSIAEGDPELDWPQSSRNAVEAVARGDAREKNTGK